MASTKDERQYIQRTGRILRPSKNKTHATVWDFLVLPGTKKELSKLEKGIIFSELKRVVHFRDHCLNNQEITKEVNLLLKDYGIDEIDNIDFDSLND